MTTKEEKLKAVETGAKAFAELETAIEAIGPLMDNLRKALLDCHNASIGRLGEYLITSNRIGEARGKVDGVLADIIERHQNCTEIAKRENCDAVIPATYAITGGATTMGGGDR